MIFNKKFGRNGDENGKESEKDNIFMGMKRSACGFFTRGTDDNDTVVFDRGKECNLNRIIAELNKFSKCEEIEIDPKKDKEKKFVYESWNALIEKIKEFCNMYNQKEALGVEFDRAKYVLTAYYAKDNIRDCLERVNIYISSLSDSGDPSTAFQACYSNYIFFISRDINELKEKYQLYATTSKETDEQLIFEHEFSDLNFVKKIKEINDTAKIILRKGQNKNFSKEDDNNFRNLTNSWEEYRKGSYNSDCQDDIETVENKIQQLKKQIEAMNKEIQKSKELYVALLETLSEDWFKLMSPSDDRKTFETIEEVKEYLSNAMSNVNEKLLKVYVEN